MNTIQQAYELGQSVWIDFIRRSFLTSGQMGELIQEGVAGMTSNPTIFEKAITGSTDYDRPLEDLAGKGLSPFQIYDALTLEDIGLAADLLRPVYEKTGGRDGYVSLEVNPHLAHDTEGTVREGLRLFTTLTRPNVMIKVPATAEGIPAIEELTLQGVNVNVTLIFSLQQYRDAAQAYLVGLKKRAARGQPVETLASVASVFVSRIDTSTDPVLAEKGLTDLLGQTAIANARLIYAHFTEIFSGHDWDGISARGGRPQRPLWASTSTKNPSYPDTIYVDNLIGPRTVNTLPLETLRAFLDHGTARAVLGAGLEEAVRHMKRLEESRIDMETITRDLLGKGVASFTDSFDSLLEGIGTKARHLRSSLPAMSCRTPGRDGPIRETLARLEDQRVADRLWAHDHTLWKDSPDQISNRLGWLHSPEAMGKEVPGIMELVETLRLEGYTEALLLGMGGSSLAPDLFRRTFGVREGYLDLRVLDSTDPAAVKEQGDRLDPSRTLFIVSSKSGTTAETLSHLKYFFNQTAGIVGGDQAGRHFIAITDPHSSLQALARDLGFRKVYLNDPDIGGRYSALSFFGLVPAALLGLDLELLLKRAGMMASLCSPGGGLPGSGNPGIVLGAVMGTLHNCGLDKLTLVTSPSLGALGAWLEQLLAESTGKEGKGILPVDGEVPGRPEVYGQDRIFVYLTLAGEDPYGPMMEGLAEAGHPLVSIRLADLYDVGGEFFRWEVATATAAHVMGINPFDQPNVEAAKVQARRMLEEYRKEGRLPAEDPSLTERGIEVYSDLPGRDLKTVFSSFLQTGRQGDYVALQAYLPPTPEAALALGELRHLIRERRKVATTVGFGPRFLHSTGQLHKGDGGNGLFIQITAHDPEDLPIPDEAGKEGSSISFGVLKTAQAMGDRQALLDAGRRVIRFHLKGDVVEGIRRLKEAMG